MTNYLSLTFLSKSSIVEHYCNGCVVFFRMKNKFDHLRACGFQKSLYSHFSNSGHNLNSGQRKKAMITCE